MSVFITADSLYYGKESEEIIFRPLFAGEDIMQFGFKIRLTKERKVTLNMWDAVRKKMRSYSSGFQGGAVSNRTAKQVYLKKFKVEANDDKENYKDTIYDLVVNSGGTVQNDLTGTAVQDAQRKLFGETLKHDVFMNGFLGNQTMGTWDGTNYSWVTTDATFNADTGVLIAAGKDVRYNTIDGIWESIMDNIVNEAAADKITRVTMANGAVQMDITSNYTGLTAGSTGVSVNGRAFAVAYTTNIATTLDLFVSTHAATMKALTPAITVTRSSNLLKFVSDVPGAPILLASAIGTGITETFNTVTANTVASTTLSTDEAITAFKNAFTNSTIELRAELRKGHGVFLVTQSMWDNYEETLSSSNPTALESMRSATQEGITMLKYRGVPLKVLEIDALLEEDTANEYPHRAILTVPMNIELILNGSIGETRYWFNVDENENRQRSQFEMGIDFIEPRLITAIY